MSTCSKFMWKTSRWRCVWTNLLVLLVEKVRVDDVGKVDAQPDVVLDEEVVIKNLLVENGVVVEQRMVSDYVEDAVEENHVVASVLVVRKVIESVLVECVVVKRALVEDACPRGCSCRGCSHQGGRIHQSRMGSSGRRCGRPKYCCEGKLPGSGAIALVVAGSIVTHDAGHEDVAADSVVTGDVVVSSDDVEDVFLDNVCKENTVIDRALVDMVMVNVDLEGVLVRVDHDVATHVDEMSDCETPAYS